MDLIIPDVLWERGRGSAPSSSTHGIKLKLIPQTHLDKRRWLLTSSLWSHDLRVLYRLGTLVETSAKIKNQRQWISFVKGTYWWNFQVYTATKSRDTAWSLFFHKTRTCKFSLSWKIDHLCMLIIFKIFMYKFFSLGRSFIIITQVVLKLNEKFVQGIGSIHLLLHSNCAKG